MKDVTDGYACVVGTVEAIVFDSDKPSEKVKEIKNVLAATFDLVRAEIQQRAEGGKQFGQASTGD